MNQSSKQNIFVSIYRFFFPKGGWKKAFYGGVAKGSNIGEKKAKNYYDKKKKK